MRAPDGREDVMVYHPRYRGAGLDQMTSTQRYRCRADATPDFGRPIASDVEQAVPSGQASSG